MLTVDDNVSWQQRCATTTSTGGNQVITLPSAVTARYVKLDLVKRGTGWGNSIWEVELYAN